MAGDDAAAAAAAVSIEGRRGNPVVWARRFFNELMSIQGDFGARCLAAFDRSEIRKQGFLDNDYFVDMLKRQIDGSGGYSFHLWTVLNAVLWHESWIMGNEDCF